MQEAELEAKRVEAERLAVEKRRNEMMQEVAPAPRVRPMAWIGPLAEAVEPAALPLAPPRYPRKKPKVAPAPESVSDGLSSSAADRVGQPSSALGLLLSPFVVSQTLIGSAVGFGIVFGFFTLVLRRESYLLADPMITALILCAPPLTAFLGPLFAPLALLEAADKGWVGYVEAKNIPPCLSCMPFIIARSALVRLLALVAFTCAIWIPAGLVTLIMILTPPYGASTVVLFAALYVTSATLVVLPLGILGCCKEENYDRCISRMSTDPSKLRRLLQRVTSLPFL